MDLQVVKLADNSILLPSNQVHEILSSHIEMEMKKGEKTNDLPFLPLELLIEILSVLSAESLLRFKCVSKSFYNLISSSGFVKLHLSRSLKAHSEGTLIAFGNNCIHAFDFNVSPCHATKLYYPESVDYFQKLVGSCNGLLCFSCQADEVALYNPATRACKNLPKITLKSKSLELCTPLGFGYDCISDDYKVLRCSRSRPFDADAVNVALEELINMPDAVYAEPETLLYSLRTNAWITVQNPPWTWETILSPGIVANSCLHWMGCEHKEIKCFDLFTQQYYEMPLPEKISPGYSPMLCVLRGQLCVVTFYFDIWILKEHSVQDSWTRLFRCPSGEWNSLYKVLSYWRRFRCLSVARSEDRSKILVALMGDEQIFICCDLKLKEARKIQIPGLPPQCSSILPWTESLVPLSSDAMN